MANSVPYDSRELIEAERPPWPLRLYRWLVHQWRPYLGWGVFLTCMALAALPATALRVNDWLNLGGAQMVLELTGPLAVAVVWALWGWRRERSSFTAEAQRTQRPASSGLRVPRDFAVTLFRWLLLLVLGPLVVSQLLIGWMPGPATLWQAAVTRNGYLVVSQVSAEWSAFIVRVALWWGGVQAGGAAQDNLVFGATGGLILWLVGSLVGWLARYTRQGYAAATPALWLLGVLLLYSSGGKYLLVTGLALTILLQLLLDHDALSRRWERLGLDYSSGLFVDRVITVFGAAALVLTLATVMPNLYFRPLVMRYYEAMAPFNEGVEAFLERLFPDVRATSRLRGGGIGGGLPNEFLLQGGPSISGVEVMRVRTNESSIYIAPYEEAPPPGHYMRGGTLADYDGKGWSNSRETTRIEVEADQRWQTGELWGRKFVVQSVILEMPSTILYAAPEPVEVSTDARLDRRAPDDLVALWSRERSYTVVSAVPAVNEEMLRSLPAWDEDHPLPEGYERHLALPESVTERTRALTAEVIAGQPTMYDKAAAIESYLRQYEYDLSVQPPPATVEDVADYFLFDLQRGYCDYYATAFVVMARLAGLPTRFATGFAVGSWNPIEGVWVITEAEAHSWPEVYFPQVGWIAFEPTAGRPTLARIASPQANLSAGSATAPLPAPAPPEVPARWNWQMLFWLLPLGLAVWGLWVLAGQWRSRRTDPWQALLQWGRRAGRPMSEGETVLEYGAGLAEFVLNRWPREPDAGRIVAREVRGLSSAVSTMRYGPASNKPAAAQQIAAHWERIRHYLAGGW
ncbi:MAG TPA: transglutaminase domain-containing protein [Caldilineaceae bacterium]|nr:transglutaminase domain-containing protein [Caldilineaceae bacterium]